MIFKQPVVLLAFFCICLASLNVHAQRFSRGGGGGGSSVGPSVGVMALFGQGKTGDGTTLGVPDRSMIHTPIAIFAGFNIRKFRIGINYEYDMVGQSDDPANYLNQNLGGKVSAPGLRLGYYNGRTSVDFIYRLSEKYTLDKPTVSGSTSEYDGKSGYGIQIYTQIKKKFGIVIDYTMGEYTSAAGNSNDLKWSRIGFGIVFTNFAGSKR